jgi:hypothetical protein
MEKQILLELIDKGLTVQKIADHEKCSFTNVRYWLRKYGLNTKTYNNKGKSCQVCGGELKGRQTLYCSKKCKVKELLKYDKTAADKMREKGLKRKIHFVNQLGGKCQCCGYDKNLAALTFHHIDPENKSFNLDIRKMTNTRMSSLEDEAKKCQLLCQNCHTELHNQKHNNWK